MHSSDTTGTVRSWYFTLHTQEPLTPEQNDIMDTHDVFADSFIGRVQGPGFTDFVCYYDAETLTEAIAEILALVEYVPGVLIRSVELNPFDLENNNMATAAVVRPPD
ncbi:hypothetical protein [Streptomyces jumonjinensis]|uniref:hypothetical protein n=1 Tax=Streptomyces jumonjinensis TaxID=1945 RepID=UPI0037901EDF